MSSAINISNISLTFLNYVNVLFSSNINISIFTYTSTCHN